MKQINVLIVCMLLAACSGRPKNSATTDAVVADSIAIDTVNVDHVLFEDRDMLDIFINMNDELMVGGDYLRMDQLKDRVVEFISNPYNDETLPKKVIKNIPYFGDIFVAVNHVICVRKHVKTSDVAFQTVMNELKAAYKQLWNELANEKWNKEFVECAPTEQQAIKAIYPQRMALEPYQFK